MEVDTDSVAENLQHAAANLLSDIKSICRTSQKTVDQVVVGVNCLMDYYLLFLKEKLDAECTKWDGNISLKHIHSVLASLTGQSVFEGVQTKSKLDSYLQEHSGGKKVILKKVVLESKEVISRNGLPRMVPYKFGYVVPFLAQLEQLLNCKDVLDCVDNPLPPQDGVLRGVTDGLFYKYHPVVQKNGPQTLCFFIHVDDAETCDPLKSKSGQHALRLFYWVLGNIHPDKRSTLKAINLLAIVKAKVAKAKGNSAFLEDFITVMKMLGSEGVDLKINGVIRRFFGVLLFAAADNPASANLGGFKETHTALRPCRSCMVKSSNLNDCFVMTQTLLRKISEHEEQLNQVLFHNISDKSRNKSQVKVVNVYEGEEEEEEEADDLSDIEVPEEKYLDHRNPSVNFGINSGSILADAPGFDVTKCLPQDLLHLLAEGVVELTCRKILKDLCIPPATKKGTKRVKAPLSLKKVNQMIESKCDLSHYNVSKPSPIEAGHLKGSKLKQSGSQMLVLLHLMPFLVYQVCPQEKMDLLILLIQLVDHCMSLVSTQADFLKIERMVEDFGTRFVKIYPNVRSLKLHCIVHLAMQGRLFGPLRQQFCFRYEAMHSKFTNIAPVIRSKKNIALSGASRYLSERNTELMNGQKTGSYLYGGDTVLQPKPIQISDLKEKKSLLEQFPELSEDSTIFETRQVVRHSSTWKKGVVILIEENGQKSLFGRIDKVYVDTEGHIIFMYYEYVTQFVTSFNAFQVLRCGSQLQTLTLTQLMHQFPVTRFCFNLATHTTVAYLLLQCPGGNQ